MDTLLEGSSPGFQKPVFLMFGFGLYNFQNKVFDAPLVAMNKIYVLWVTLCLYIKMVIG